MRALALAAVRNWVIDPISSSISLAAHTRTSAIVPASLPRTEVYPSRSRNQLEIDRSNADALVVIQTTCAPGFLYHWYPEPRARTSANPGTRTNPNAESRSSLTRARGTKARHLKKFSYVQAQETDGGNQGSVASPNDKTCGFQHPASNVTLSPTAPFPRILRAYILTSSCCNSTPGVPSAAALT